jgi:excisionase family DNA binding protein
MRPKDIDVNSLVGLHLYNVNEAAALLGIGRDKMYKLILQPERDTKKPAIHSVKMGRHRKIPAKALEKYIDRLMEAA